MGGPYMLRSMQPQRTDGDRRQRLLREERLLQTGAALLLAFAVFVVIVFRAAMHDVFTPGWWRH